MCTVEAGCQELITGGIVIKNWFIEQKFVIWLSNVSGIS